MGKHALLSASSAHRWLHCPPSARVCESFEDKGSNYAAEGTDAHTLCEHKLKTLLGIPSKDPTEDKLLADKDEIIVAFEDAKDLAFDLSNLTAEQDNLQNELLVVSPSSCISALRRMHTSPSTKLNTRSVTTV